MFLLQSPILSFKAKKNDLPQKLEYTEVEQQCNEVLKKLDSLERNIRVQKQNLRDYYSSQDRYDYRELLKERRRVAGQLRRIAKNAGVDEYELEFCVRMKREYNYYAPKIVRAKSKPELNQVLDLINSSSLYVKTKELLAQLIGKKKF